MLNSTKKYYLGYDINRTLSIDEISIKGIIDECNPYAENHYKKFGLEYEIGYIVYDFVQMSISIGFQDKLPCADNDYGKDHKNYLSSITVDLEQMKISKFNVDFLENFRQDPPLLIDSFVVDIDNIKQFAEERKMSVQKIQIFKNYATISNNGHSIKVNMTNGQFE